MNWKSSTTLAASGLGDSPCSCETQGMITLSENIPTRRCCSGVKPAAAASCYSVHQIELRAVYPIINLKSRSFTESERHGGDFKSDIVSHLSLI